MKLLPLVLHLWGSTPAVSFTTSPRPLWTRTPTTTTSTSHSFSFAFSSSFLAMAKKSKSGGGKNKGFAKTTDISSSTASSSSSSTSSLSTTTTEASPQSLSSPPKQDDSSSTSSSTTMNAGQRALAEMRRQKAEERDAELRKARELMQIDQQVAETPAAIPEQVAQRMGLRMLPFVGLPLFLGMGAFVAFWYFATYKNMEFQPVLVAGTTIGMLVIGLLGITYSVMSASWDADREGSFLGTDEFQRNVKNIQEGLQRSQENAALRDKMATSQEFSSALQELDQKEKESLKTKKKQSLQDKLQDEMD